MPAAIEQKSIVSVTILELRDSTILLGLPGTEYRTQLTLTVPASDLNVAVGKRIRGTIEATSLRVHPATGGGRFFEPMWGEPRIIAGRVLVVDRDANRVLLESATKLWVTVPPEQDFDVLQEGSLVNCYIESGARFTPAH